MRLIDADELIKYIKIWEIGMSISSDQKEFINCELCPGVQYFKSDAERK